ncbi:MAG: T9SS type A sorting domain-containing protein [Ignavibacteriae bacterium]|nr:T9SS type A sorting domain-containing protein [Ignavibacteriota bacterium]
MHFLFSIGIQHNFYRKCRSGRYVLCPPANIPNATVGDTIKWVWVSGIHTTTSTSIPSGADVWDAPIDIASTTFIYKISAPGTYNYQCTFHTFSGMVGSFAANPVGIKETGEIAKGFKLAQNYPNPFNPSTTIKFSLPQSGFVTLIIYDISGKELKTLVNNQLSSGSYKLIMDGSDLSSGIYFYKLTAGNFREIKRMVLIK